MQWVGGLFASHLADNLIMPGFFKRLWPALYAALLVFAPAPAPAPARCVIAEPDEQRLGGASYPIGTARSAMSQSSRVGSWSAMEQVPGFVHRKFARGETTAPLARAARGGVQGRADIQRTALSPASRAKLHDQRAGRHPG